jgi:hypothetical protein
MKGLDTIDVEKYSTKRDDGSLSYQGITLLLNGLPVKGTFDAIEFATSLSVGKKVTGELMTCSCGNAGCAGIWEGTKIKVRSRTVEWTDIDSGLPKRFHSFDRVAYAAAIAKTVTLMKEIAAENAVRVKNEDYDRYASLINYESEDEVDHAIAYRVNWRKMFPD